VEGKLIKTLINDMVDEGFNAVTWDATDTRGNKVSSGVYFYSLKVGKKLLTRKMVVLK
jgi:flagellar hook assembly protein FlgD